MADPEPAPDAAPEDSPTEPSDEELLAAAALAEEAPPPPPPPAKKKGKKEISPEEIAAAKEERRLLIKSFYLKKWDEVKENASMFNLWLEEGYPGAEYQPPVSEDDLWPIIYQIATAELVKFEPAMAPLLLTPEYRREDVKNYTAAAMRYGNWLYEKSQGNQAANVPPLPGCQPPKKGRTELRSRLIVEYITIKTQEMKKEAEEAKEKEKAEKAAAAAAEAAKPKTRTEILLAATAEMSGEKKPVEEEEEPIVIEPVDEVAALNIIQVEWYPLRDLQKIEKPKDKNDEAFLMCKNMKCQDKYIPKIYVKCGACDLVYCSYDCQREDWPTHQNEKKCNGTFSKNLNSALRARDMPRIKPHLPYLRLLMHTLAKMNVHEGMVWYTMAYLRDSEWQKYANLKTKEQADASKGSVSADTFVWPCFTACCVSRNRADAKLSQAKDASRTPRIVFEIKCIEGYRFSQYVESTDPTTEVMPERDEVLLLPGSMFRVVSSEATASLLHMNIEQIATPYNHMSEPEC